jgi:multidrug resistance efflux pump
MREFTADVVAAQARIIDANAILENDQATLADMKKEIQRFKIENQAKLLGGDLALINNLRTMQASYDSLERKIIRDKEVLAKNERLLKDAEERKKIFENYIPVTGTSDKEFENVIERMKETFEKRKKELEARREKVVLKAPCDGYVSDIQGTVGEAVMQGVEILRIAEEKPSAIIAYASEAVVGQLKIGKAVEIVKDSKPEQIAHSKLTYIGPAVEQMPMRLWRNPNFPQWGRPMWIEIPMGMNLIPGEMVGIRGL